MKKIVCLLSFVFIGLNTFAQNSNRTLLTVANEDVSVDDFLSIYNKNREVGEELDPKTLDEYLNLFVNFKLKVKEAEALGMDTIPSFVKELAGYRKQLAKPYLVDNEAGDQLLLEAYNRLKVEIRASHILISVGADAAPADTLIAFNKIQKLRNELLKGGDFAATARLHSQDPSARENQGDLGFFSALYMVYPFENAAYNTAVGEVSEIIRTRFGYHILKVTDKRESRGEVKTAHIMVKFRKPTGQNNAEDIAVAQEKIYEIYQKLNTENADFAEMAKQYSDDKNNSAKGGELPWFGTNRMVASFENAAFSLEEKGDISSPIQTPYGWHIIKLIDKKGIGSFEEEQEELKKKVEKDSRSQVKRSSLVSKLKKEYNYSVNNNSIKELKEIVNADFMAGNWSISDYENKLAKPVFTLDNKKFTQAEFAIYLLSSARRAKSEMNVAVFVDDNFTKWSEDLIIKYEDSNLENKYNEFRLLMQEYRDGILLYELTDENIWTKAVKDTLGLQTYYEENKQNYMWDTRVDAKILNFQDVSIATKVQKKLKKGKVDIAKLQEKINKNSPLNMDVNAGLYSKGENAFVDGVNWTVGVSDLIEDNQNTKLVLIEKVRAPQIKELDEAKGLITSDYQDYLEKNWLQELRTKYSVEVNEHVLSLLKNNRLSELEEEEVEEVGVPKFEGSFYTAFRSAVNTLGASKSNVFEWYGNLYTTELK